MYPCSWNLVSDWISMLVLHGVTYTIGWEVCYPMVAPPCGRQGQYFQQHCYMNMVYVYLISYLRSSPSTLHTSLSAMYINLMFYPPPSPSNSNPVLNHFLQPDTTLSIISLNTTPYSAPFPSTRYHTLHHLPKSHTPFCTLSFNPIPHPPFSPCRTSLIN